MYDARNYVSSPDLERSLCAAKSGSMSALGHMLDLYRDYLLAIANDMVGSDIVPKAAPSDLVQETQFEAIRDFRTFQGSTEGELKAWLKRILVRNVQDVHRKYRIAEKSKASLEIPLDANDGSAPNLMLLEGANGIDESGVRRCDALDWIESKLSCLTDDQRHVIKLRCLEGKSEEQVAQQIDRSIPAVRKLLTRGIRRLTLEIHGGDTVERIG